MKTIANTASITDNSETVPITVYSNAVRTLVRTPDDDGKRFYYKVVYVSNYDCPRNDCECVCGCCRNCCD